MNPLLELKSAGQSIWLDYIRRSLITSGDLKRMVDEDGVTGVTSNPTIFEKAISGSSDYDATIKERLKIDPHTDTRALYEELIVGDIQMAADVLRSVYDETQGRDGYVSLELSPNLADDTEGSIKEARYFWKLVDRANVMLKVPATKEGVPVIETLISEGINVNITLMFSLDHYEAVSEAYIRGLEKCDDPSKVASVASFFVSRVDSVVDNSLKEIGTKDSLDLKGKVAIANSKLAYQRYKEVFSGERWKRLTSKGARVQRVLWASTGTKDPEYSDVLYIEGLIGPDTVNTMPPATLSAFKDHGCVSNTIEAELGVARKTVDNLEKLRIDLDEITEKLQVVGAAKFSKSYEQLIAAIDEKGEKIRTGQIARQTMKLGDIHKRVDERLKEWKKIEFGRRLAEKDSTLWFEKPVHDITTRLGWFDLPESMHDQLDNFSSFAREIKEEGFVHIVLLGMGGSSLAPEVYQKTFGNTQGYPELIILDSTHPDSIKGVEAKIDYKSTLFIVASKSGATLEPLSFFKYFWDNVSKLNNSPGRQFIAITDPETSLAKLGFEKGFRRVFYAHPDLGGRYSALTTFGLLPAALIGMNVHPFLDRAWIAKEACAFCVEETEVLGLRLGAALGELAIVGRDKMTFFTTPSLKSFPSWLEQLIAESTGKKGRGILPVVDEPPTSAEEYGQDRIFVYFILDGDNDLDHEPLLSELEDLGHPTIRIHLSDKEDIAQEIFKWEVATASAGAVLGIHPFNQPDVEFAKELAREAIKIETEESEADSETMSFEDQERVEDSIKNWLEQAQPSDYIAIQAYLKPDVETNDLLMLIRKALMRRTHLATTVGYGPRFLHSTGQLHKGGPNTGLFLQIADSPGEDLTVPGAEYTFGDIIKAQSLGDFQAMKSRGRRVLRITVDRDVLSGLRRISDIISYIDLEEVRV
jgi:transaldolase/glucose-6-phosphate isomerase